jgi:hypothetical protein
MPALPAHDLARYAVRKNWLSPIILQLDNNLVYCPANHHPPRDAWDEMRFHPVPLWHRVDHDIRPECRRLRLPASFMSSRTEW